MHLVGGIGQRVQKIVTGLVLLELLLLIKFIAVKELVAGAQVTHTVADFSGAGIMVILDLLDTVVRRE